MAAAGRAGDRRHLRPTRDPPILDLLNTAFGFAGAPDAGENALAATQAALISSLAKGVFGGDLNWGLLSLGAAMGALFGRLTTSEIWDYTCDHWGDDQSEKYVCEIQRAIKQVVDNPGIGRACDELRPGYRRHAVGTHTLYYRITSVDMIDMVRILHQRMDIDRHLD